MTKFIKLLGKPRSISQQIRKRKISWIELFYDLMFAVVFSRLTDSLVENFTLPALAYSALIFGWLLWGWNEMSGYFDNHGNDSIINILVINTEMILTGIGIIFVPEAMAGNFSRLEIILMLIELLMAAIWFGLAHYDKLHGPASRIWGLAHLAALLVLILTYFGNQFWQTAGLIGGLLLNIFAVLIANPRLKREYDQAGLQHELKDSLIERYGLMTMIALGEIIAGIYETIRPGQISGMEIVRFIISMVVIALIAAIYYQILGALQIKLSSSIATSMTGWLFIISIMFAFYIGVGLQLLLKDGQLAGKIFFIAALLLFMAAIRIIVFIGTQTNNPGEHKISWLLVVEGLVLAALIFAPATAVLIGTLVIQLVIIIQGRLFS